jgi:transcriptional regulator NrdR family protein
MAFRCPKCKVNGVAPVSDSRPTDDGAGIRRRRTCQACGHRFTTYEGIDAPFSRFDVGRVRQSLQRTIDYLDQYVIPES